MLLDTLPLELQQEIVGELQGLEPNKKDAPAWLGKPLSGQFKHSNDTLVIHSYFYSLSICSRFWRSLCRPTQLKSRIFFGEHSNHTIARAIALFGPECHLVKFLYADIWQDTDQPSFSPSAPDPQRTKLVCEFINSCTNIQQIWLDYLGASILAKAISDCAATLIRLHLTTYKLYSRGHYELASCIRRLTNLKHLSLFFLRPEDERSIDEVWKAIAAVPKLASFNLCGGGDQIDFIDIASLPWKGDLTDLSLSPVHGYSLGSVLDHISKHFASSLRKLALGVVGSPNIKDSPEPYFLPNLKELTLKDTMPINILQHFSASPVRTLNFVRSPHCEWHEFRKYILAKDTLPFLEHLDLQAARFGPSPTKEDWEAFEKEFVQAHKVVKITSPRLQS